MASPRELVDQLMIAKAETRTGKPVRLGNDPTLMPDEEDTCQSYGTAPRSERKNGNRNGLGGACDKPGRRASLG